MALHSQHFLNTMMFVTFQNIVAWQFCQFKSFCFTLLSPMRPNNKSRFRILFHNYSKEYEVSDYNCYYYIDKNSLRPLKLTIIFLENIGEYNSSWKGLVKNCNPTYNHFSAEMPLRPNFLSEYVSRVWIMICFCHCSFL